jgi:hypothetical protein
MKTAYAFWFTMLCTAQLLLGQANKASLQPLIENLNAVQAFTAQVKLRTDIPFISMPEKEAMIVYEKEKPLQISSSDFALIPKRGLDFTFSELFEHPYLAIDRGTEVVGGLPLKVVSIVPESAKAEFSIATLYWDPKQLQVHQAQISTKKDGTYTVHLQYGNNTSALPSQVRVDFEMERIRLPLHFMGSDTQIDRKKMREQELKTGSIFLQFTYLSTEN